jgi:hypothetical protein
MIETNKLKQKKILVKNFSKNALKKISKMKSFENENE